MPRALSTGHDGNNTPEAVRDWWDAQLATGKRTQALHAYTLLKSIFESTVEAGLIDRQPCRIDGEATDLWVREVEVVREGDEVAYVELDIDSSVVQVKCGYEEGSPKPLDRKVLIFGEDAALIPKHDERFAPKQRRMELGRVSLM